jgi:hypothetical protein
MKIGHAIVWTAAAIVMAAAPAWANDSTAELSTGGLVFARTPDIEMRAEDLFISTQQIRVAYRFFNHADKDVTTIVAFPMPDITVSGPDDNIAVPTEDAKNILGFATKVDGAPVEAQVEQKVFAKGIDRTPLLVGMGIPLQPYLESANQALDKLPRDKWDELIKLGLADTMEEDVGKGMTTHLQARWTLKTSYFWRQTFPAGREIVIEHMYKPSVGSSAGALIALPDMAKDPAHAEPAYAEYVRKYCIDRDFLTTLNAAKKASSNVYYSEERISYILTTGANWAGPIKDFRLVVDKGAPGKLVSFCGQGVRKIGPTQFEMRHADFMPQANFDVLLLTRQPNN